MDIKEFVKDYNESKNTSRKLDLEIGKEKKKQESLKNTLIIENYKNIKNAILKNEELENINVFWVDKKQLNKWDLEEIFFEMDGIFYCFSSYEGIFVRFLTK